MILEIVDHDLSDADPHSDDFFYRESPCCYVLINRIFSHLLSEVSLGLSLRGNRLRKEYRREESPNTKINVCGVDVGAHSRVRDSDFGARVSESKPCKPFPYDCTANTDRF